jgi:hypothetical protein
MVWFSCIHTQRLINRILLRVHYTPLKIKRLEMNLKHFKILTKLYKHPLKIKNRVEKKRKEKKKKVRKDKKE